MELETTRKSMRGGPARSDWEGALYERPGGSLETTVKMPGRFRILRAIHFSN